MVGLDRLELSTSVLSGPRSNRLSYRPTKGYDKLYPLGVLVSSGVYGVPVFPSFPPILPRLEKYCICFRDTVNLRLNGQSSIVQITCAKM